ncbi:tumor necrosis factor receptor superfamily member 6-like isoform X3 [Lemur catta]|uniref:tumor necrosis factor receptor superfamily member 6-like isoform X3 n=1 Tax=Lemur catta TaxID=9447 RepID=UPI001E26A71C|nr:tumor necrosis factor receptor superfamily member 6-like isoform X3 [Lemur catta]
MVARVLRPLLLLAGSVTFATSVTSCGPDMYPSEDLCCKLCPAGYYVSRHCSTNHSRGECTPCGPGTFMAHNNSRLYCQLCNQCREDQEPVTNCSATSDRQCQCKTGQYYCDSADCTEICFRCSRCPGGRKPLRPCNATANTVCPEPENVNWYWLFLLVLPVSSIIILAIYYVKKGRHRVQQWMGKFLKRESNEPGISEYAQKYFLKDMSCDATNRIYYEIGHEVPKSKWKMFMRFIQLEENEIEICEHENPGNVMEQHHKMLLRWRNNHGKDSSVFKLMAALHTMGLDVPLQNIISKLLAEDILGRHAGTPS